MLKLASVYFIAIFTVQVARFIKRLYVRRFANNINRNMKQTYYNNLVHTDTSDLKNINTGNAMTKALSDVDACSEGIRKFTTEIFDTGVALFSYIFMLFAYDWKLAFLCLIFPPVSYVIAERMKAVVLKTGAACKESAGRLNAATLDASKMPLPTVFTAVRPREIKTTNPTWQITKKLLCAQTCQ